MCSRPGSRLDVETIDGWGSFVERGIVADTVLEVFLRPLHGGGSDGLRDLLHVLLRRLEGNLSFWDAHAGAGLAHAVSLLVILDDLDRLCLVGLARSRVLVIHERLPIEAVRRFVHPVIEHVEVFGRGLRVVHRRGRFCVL